MGSLSARLGASSPAQGAASVAMAIFILALLAVFVFLLVRSRRRDRKKTVRGDRARAAAVRRAAARLGLEYSEDAPAGFSTALMHGALSNFLSGRWKGIDMVEADSTTYYKGRPFHHSVVAGEISANLPPITIEYAPADARLGEHLHPGRLHLESEDFDRAYSIGAKDQQFATEFLDARMVSWLMANGSAARWEIGGSRVVLTHRERVVPGAIRGLLNLCAEFVDRIPNVVLADHPPVDMPS